MQGPIDRFTGARVQAGVQRHTIRQPVDNPTYVLIDLDFETVDEAQAFLGVLKSRAWSTQRNSPALAGTPQTRVLETVETS